MPLCLIPREDDVKFQPWEALGNPRYTPLKNGWKLELCKDKTISKSNLHSWVPFVNFPGRIFKVWCSFNLLLGSAQLELQPKEVPAQDPAVRGSS